MKSITLYIGLDVHKDSIVIAIAEPGRNGEIRNFGTITNDLQALEKAINRIRKAHPLAVSVSLAVSNNSKSPAWSPLLPSFPNNPALPSRLTNAMPAVWHVCYVLAN
jgi:hypothetical protein